MLFMTNETVIFKDGKGINREVLYLGPIYSDGILKHKIRTHNDAEFLVDGILLSSLDTPDIATIPFTPEQYAVDLSKLTEAELRQISTPQSLDDDQREFMELHYKIQHLPLPAMIMLAEKGRIKKIRKTQALASNLHVVYFWYGTLQTMAFQGLKRID